MRYLNAHTYFHLLRCSRVQAIGRSCTTLWQSWLQMTTTTSPFQASAYNCSGNVGFKHYKLKSWVWKLKKWAICTQYKAIQPKNVISIPIFKEQSCLKQLGYSFSPKSSDFLHPQANFKLLRLWNWFFQCATSTLYSVQKIFLKLVFPTLLDY